MGKQTVDTAQKPDPEVERFQAAKASFEAALKKTSEQQGLQAAAEPAKEEAEKPAEDPKKAAVVKPAPTKPAAPKTAAAQKPKPEPQKPDPLVEIQAQLKALQAKLDAKIEPEPEDDELEGIKAELVERFGDEEGAALAKALEAVHAPAKRRIEQLENFLRDATNQGAKNVARTNRSRLAATWPHLAENDEAWSVIRDRVEAVTAKDPAKFESLEDAYDAVAEAVYGGIAVSGEKPDQDAEEEAARISASAMSAPAKSGQDKKLTQMQAAKAVFEHLKKNPEDKAGAKRLARELKLNR